MTSKQLERKVNQLYSRKKLVETVGDLEEAGAKFSFNTKVATVDQNVVTNGLGKVRVVPNPYLVASQYEQEFGVLRREPIRQLKFTKMPPVCTIYIFTLDGDQVQTIEHNSSDGVATWDMRAAGGREIAAGVYLYLVKTDTAERLDRFAVIK